MDDRELSTRLELLDKKLDFLLDLEGFRLNIQTGDFEQIEEREDDNDEEQEDKKHYKASTPKQ